MFIVPLHKVFPFRRLASSVGPTDLSDCSYTEGPERCPRGLEAAQHPPNTRQTSCWTRNLAYVSKQVLAQLKGLFLGGALPEFG